MNHAAAHANPPARSTPGRAWRGWFLVFAAFWASFAPAWSAAVPVDDLFDGAPAPGSLAWSTAPKYKTGVQYSAEYQAAAQVVAQVTAPDYEASRVRARAQNSHLGFFGDPAKTHRENPAQVARVHQENEVTAEKTALGRSVGSNTDPASLHKYNYANANPISGFDPSGHYTLTQMMQAVFYVGNLARMAIPVITRFAFRITQRLAAAALRPFFVFAGGLPLAIQMGQRLSVFDRFQRFFITPTQGYMPVASWLKDLFQMMGVRLQQGHVFIQQAWYRAGSANQWYPGDVAANLGMQRLANAGFNLLAMPSGLNRALGANNLQGSVGTTAFAGSVVAGSATAITWALDNLWELITGSEADEEPSPPTP